MPNATNWTTPSINATNYTAQSVNATNYGTQTYLSMADDTITLDNDVYILSGYDPSVITKYTNKINWVEA